MVNYIIVHFDRGEILDIIELQKSFYNRGVKSQCTGKFLCELDGLGSV